MRASAFGYGSGLETGVGGACRPSVALVRLPVPAEHDGPNHGSTPNRCDHGQPFEAAHSNPG